MDKKLQRAIIKYIQKCKEVPRDQVINEVSKFQDCEKINTQEAINILLDDKKIMIVGLADTFALTRKGHETLDSWHKRIYYFVRDNFLTILSLIKKIYVL